MTVFKFSAKMILSLSVLLVASSAFAGFWKWSTPYQGPTKDVLTLMVTSNYATPVMIAQLIQHENRQPFILLPKAGETKIFFWPAGKKNLALEIRKKNLARFIKFLHPKQVIVLGDKRYVAQQYLDAIDKNIPTVVIRSDNWGNNALTLQKMLRLNNLYRDFKRLNNEAKSGLYKPTKRSQPMPQEELLKPASETVKVEVDTNKVEADTAKVEGGSKSSAVATPTKKIESGGIKEPEIKTPAEAEPVLIEE